MDREKTLVLGDEAVALGAIDAGMSVAYGYPGTPSTEILEYVQAYREREDTDLVARWCSNEKTATEGGVGVSFAGKRCLVTMKHDGLNVAMDAFVNACLLEIHGGMVLAVADDPGMHSSQNEQDTRFLTDFAHTICLEPRNQQEAYDMTREAFQLSETFHVPVVVRLVTRLSHARSVITRAPATEKSDLGKALDRSRWMTLPALARKGWAHLLEQQREFTAWSEGSRFNQLDLNPACTEFAVITSGLGGNYYAENEAELALRPSRLHVGTYPLPVEKIRRLAESADRVVLIEEGYPYIERQLRSILGQPVEIRGKMDGAVPIQGELNADNVRAALGLPERTTAAAATLAGSQALPGRPPQLCRGCPHIYSFQALNEAREGLPSSIVTSDIGCYALGALPPYDAVETILCMGASIGMANGAAQAGQANVVATIGDSTFFHSGIPGLVDAVAAGTAVTIVILDNGTTGMTGGQDTVAPGSVIREIAVGAGVDPEHIVLIDPIPKKHAENVEIYRREMAYDGVSVVIPVRECVQTALQRQRRSKKTESAR
ncbi:MAG: thiamine pyrophosphate-dependent enzyme [Spirochaeta sp.]|nr:thiamine pyrophosphate-dependent enzyme [Spirochaeta sp.]